MQSFLYEAAYHGNTAFFNEIMNTFKSSSFKPKLGNVTAGSRMGSQHAQGAGNSNSNQDLDDSGLRYTWADVNVITWQHKAPVRPKLAHPPQFQADVVALVVAPSFIHKAACALVGPHPAILLSCHIAGYVVCWLNFC
jgi:hypothetical protein